jgi:hypothetical protein
MDIADPSSFDIAVFPTCVGRRRPLPSFAARAIVALLLLLE